MTQEIQKPESKFTEFVPYGGQDKVRLGVDMVKALIAVPTKSGKTCSDRDAIKFIALCQAQRLNPFAGDAFLIGYDSKDGVATYSLITAHQAFLKRAELHPEFDGMQSGVIVADESGKLSDIEGDFYPKDVTVVGGWAKVYCKTRKYPTVRRIRLERFDKGFAQWEVDAAGMICKCAEADALRSTFPTLLGGCYLRGETQVETGMLESDVTRFAAQLPATASLPAPHEAPPVPKLAPPVDAADPVLELQKIVTDTGSTFKNLATVLQELGAVKDADSIPGFGFVPKSVAKQLLKTKGNFLLALAKAKAADGAEVAQ